MWWSTEKPGTNFALFSYAYNAQVCRETGNTFVPPHSQSKATENIYNTHKNNSGHTTCEISVVLAFATSAQDVAVKKTGEDRPLANTSSLWGASRQARTVLARPCTRWHCCHLKTAAIHIPSRASCREGIQEACTMKAEPVSCHLRGPRVH